MRRTAIAMALVALGGLAAATASADESSVYHEYALQRDQLWQCNLDTNWQQMSESKRAECDDLFAKYVLFGDQAPQQTWYIHCRSSSQCLATPEGYPAADGPIPEGSFVYDTKPRSTSTQPKASSHKKHRRHSRHHRR